MSADRDERRARAGQSATSALASKRNHPADVDLGRPRLPRFAAALQCRHGKRSAFEGTTLETMTEGKVGDGSGPTVGIIMGSASDWKTMRHAAETLDGLGIRYEKRVVSAHRTPDDLFRYAEGAEDRGLVVIIAGAGGAAHLPGMTAAKTIVPIIGVPVVATPLRGLDALLSIMQMPAEIGVATVGIGEKGAIDAALFAAAILALGDESLQAKLRRKRTGILGDTQPLTRNDRRRMVAILAERESDLEILRHAVDQFRDFDIPYAVHVVERDATLDDVSRCVRAKEQEGAAAFIAASAKGIDLACTVARMTLLPVLGVPIVSEPIASLDRFLEPFLDMPSGVATFAVGRPGAINAALFAATFLYAPDSDIRRRLRERRKDQVDRVRAMTI